MTDRPRYELIVEPAPADPVIRRGGRERDPVRRLRDGLKLLVRVCGFKIVSCQPVSGGDRLGPPPGAAPCPPSDTPSSSAAGEGTGG